MNLRYVKTLIETADQPARITALCWAPNNTKLAVCAADRIVSLFDDNGVRQDKFPTKPTDPKVCLLLSHSCGLHSQRFLFTSLVLIPLQTKTYVVRTMAFSPDSTKLAIAQSDGTVFVYKLGLKWGDKKSICNKFPQNTTVTCMTWPNNRQNILAFGLADGKVCSAK